MDGYLTALKRYAVFQGRSSRREFWQFTLISLGVDLILGRIDSSVLALSTPIGVGILDMLYTVAVMIPASAVLVRRLHDTGRNGWWSMLGLLPLLGQLVLLLFALERGQAQVNRYGAPPA